MMNRAMMNLKTMVMAVSVYGVMGTLVGCAVLTLGILVVSFGLCILLVIGGALTNLIGLTAIPFTLGVGVLVTNPLLQLLLSLVTAGVFAGLIWLCLIALRCCTGAFSWARRNLVA